MVVCKLPLLIELMQAIFTMGFLGVLVIVEMLRYIKTSPKGVVYIAPASVVSVAPLIMASCLTELC